MPTPTSEPLTVTELHRQAAAGALILVAEQDSDSHLIQAVCDLIARLGQGAEDPVAAGIETILDHIPHWDDDIAARILFGISRLGVALARRTEFHP